MRIADTWRTATAVAACLAGLAAAEGAAADERPWLEVRSPHFTIVSNAGEKPARDIAWQFEQVRSVFAVVWPWARRDEGRPFIVFVARDEATLRSLVPEYWTERNKYGVFDARVAGEAADFAAIRVDRGTVNPNGRENPYEMAYEAYADNVLVRHFEGRMPLWYREGLVEMFGNVIAGANDVEIGRPLQGRIFELRGGIAAGGWGHGEDRRGQVGASRKLVPLERLIAIRPDDPEFTGDAERSLYNSQAWAFTHFLMFGEGGVHRAAFNRLTDLLRAGRSGDEATRVALGDVSRFNRAYLEYIDQPSLQYQKVPASIVVAREKWPARELVEVQAAEYLAHFHVAMGHTRQARESLAVAKGAPASADVHAAEGLLLIREGDREGARAAFVRAREMGSARPWLLARLGEGRNTSPAPSRSPEDAASLIAACNAGDEAACARFAASLQSACDGGDAPACMPLAWLYSKGRGVPADLAKAEALYLRACDAGETKACTALASLKKK